MADLGSWVRQSPVVRLLDVPGLDGAPLMYEIGSY